MYRCNWWFGAALDIAEDLWACAVSPSALVIADPLQAFAVGRSAIADPLRAFAVGRSALIRVAKWAALPSAGSARASALTAVTGVAVIVAFGRTPEGLARASALVVVAKMTGVPVALPTAGLARASALLAVVGVTIGFRFGIFCRGIFCLRFRRGRYR